MVCYYFMGHYCMCIPCLIKLPQWHHGGMYRCAWRMQIYALVLVYCINWLGRTGCISSYSLHKTSFIIIRRQVYTWNCRYVYNVLHCCLISHKIRHRKKHRSDFWITTGTLYTTLHPRQKWMWNTKMYFSASAILFEYYVRIHKHDNF